MAGKRNYNAATEVDEEEYTEEVYMDDALVPKAANIDFADTVQYSNKKDSCSHFFLRDYTGIDIHKDSEHKPIWLSPEGKIYLETFSPLYSRAKDFLIAIAEPVCRPTLIHEYKLTSFSLYAAASVGLQTHDIINQLDRLSKIPITEKVKQSIRDCTERYGKVHFVLRGNQYFLECSHEREMKTLLRNPIIAGARIISKEDSEKHRLAPASTAGLTVAGMTQAKFTELQKQGSLADDPNADYVKSVVDAQDAQDEENDILQNKLSFEIDGAKTADVKQACVAIDVPLVEEYDFKNDHLTPSLKIDLKPTTVLRPYQETSLAKLFGNGRGRSGIIVLPCGAGKTLTGVTVACTVKKSCLVLCTSSTAVDQWERQFLLWSTLGSHLICQFTSGASNSEIPFPGVTITTYHMLAYQGTRSYSASKMMAHISENEWGLLIMDEVHVVPAKMFRKAMDMIHCHLKVGLTATLVREDGKTTDLNFLIGPKLYEANWMELQNAGFIAKVKCTEVWCQMDPIFFKQYLSIDKRKRPLLWTMNPNKYRATEALIRKHEKLGHKVIVFSDNIFSLIHYAITLKKIYIYGDTSPRERAHCLDKFLNSTEYNTIFISKIGDNSIDLPDANVLIQISSHFGARRQEAQRLGRILRAKKGKRKLKEGEYNAYFYDLVSCDTREMFFGSKRQQFLVDQGYAFNITTDEEVLAECVGPDDHELNFESEEDRMALLQKVLLAKEEDAEEERGANDRRGRGRGRGRRSNVRMGNMSGSSGMYSERSNAPIRDRARTTSERNKRFKVKKAQQ